MGHLNRWRRAIHLADRIAEFHRPRPQPKAHCMLAAGLSVPLWVGGMLQMLHSGAIVAGAQSPVPLPR